MHFDPFEEEIIGNIHLHLMSEEKNGTVIEGSFLKRLFLVEINENLEITNFILPFSNNKVNYGTVRFIQERIKRDRLKIVTGELHKI